jgi:hypothetical protein
MKEGADLLGRLRVASPCPASWEAMEGDERVRFCRQCELHVYDLSAMTRAEAESLVARTEGRLCARFYRRADGTVLTSDCPRGLAAARRRVARAAGAAFASLLGLFAAASGKPQQKTSCPAGGDFKVERTATSASSFASVSGVVYDPACAVIPGARVVLTNRETGRKYETRADDEGEFHFVAVTPGKYRLEIETTGFRRFVREDLRLGTGEAARLGATLDVMIMGEIVIIEKNDKPAVESGNGVTVFREKAITGLPHP